MPGGKAFHYADDSASCRRDANRVCGEGFFRASEDDHGCRRDGAVKLALIQARMGSSRFPGKVLEDLCGRPMLWHVVNRVGKARSLDKVVVATTDGAVDDPIAQFCEREGIVCFRGSEQDVLDRFYRAAEAN